MCLLVIDHTRTYPADAPRRMHAPVPERARRWGLCAGGQVDSSSIAIGLLLVLASALKPLPFPSPFVLFLLEVALRVLALELRLALTDFEIALRPLSLELRQALVVLQLAPQAALVRRDRRTVVGWR